MRCQVGRGTYLRSSTEQHVNSGERCWTEVLLISKFIPMCTEHQRNGHHHHAKEHTITRVPLQRITQPSRWSRRRLLVSTGLGTASMAILAACGSGSSSTTSTTTTTTATDTDTGATDTAEAVEAEDDPEAPAPEAEADAGSAESGELMLQHVSLGFVSAYVLVRGNEAAIVDTGTAGSGGAINDALSDLGLGPSNVRHIVLTHNHGDHAGGLGELEGEMTNATVYAGTGDIGTIQTSLTLSEVGDGDEVFGMGVVSTPGHTVGSISVFDTGTGLLVAGDAINGDGSGGITGANPDFTPDMDGANASVAKMAALMPQVAAFGHGGAPVTEEVTAKLAAIA